MISRSRIKILIVVIFLIALSVALYLRRPKDMWELKWGEGPMTCSEQAYYDNHITTIINKWREAGIKEREEPDSQSKGLYKSLLVIDFDKKALWLEKNGQIFEDEYQQYINSIADSGISKIDQNDIQAEGPSILIKENKAAWKRIEKTLYMEIERNVLKAGFQLKFVSMAPYANFTGANAYVIGNKSNLIMEILHRNPDVNTSLGIIRLNDDTWYAASRPEPKRTRSDRTMKLEFLIFPDVNMSPSQKKEYIKQGREKFRK
jgi:hypothetical protein